MSPLLPLRPRRALAACALVALAVVALASCSGGDDDKAAPTTTVAPNTTIDIKLGDVSADSAGAPTTVSPDQSQRVLDALITYVKGATVEPLRSGKPATADFSGAFDANTLASATTTDRAVVLDEGLPRVTGDLDVTSEPVAVLGLGDQGGNLALVNAALNLDITGVTKAKGGPLHVIRRADLVLQPDPAGTWKITAYTISVAREGAGLTPTTTTGASTTTGAAK
jgi:hypothetical protein